VNRFDEETLVLYAAGRVDESRRREIAEAASRDEELLATLEVIGVVCGFCKFSFRKVPPTRLQRVQDRSRSILAAARRHPVWFALVLLLAVSGMAGAGWVMLMPRSLLHDNFNDNWFDSRLWLPPPSFGDKQGIREADGRLKLVNRGYLISKQEFTGPIEVSFDWIWNELGLNPVYADHLVIVLRSAGIPTPDYPFEVPDGIVIRLNAWEGRAEVDAEPGLQNHQKGEWGEVKFSPDTWYHIRITDDGERIAVYVTGRNDPDHPDEKPVVEGSYPMAPKSGHLVIYNREQVGGVPHESWIDNVTVRPLR